MIRGPSAEIPRIMKMTEIYLGVKSHDIESIASVIRKGLEIQIQFEARYSDYRAGYHYFWSKHNEEIIIQSNYDEREVQEEDFPDCSVLVICDGQEMPAKIKDIVLGNAPGSVVIRERSADFPDK